MLPSPLGSRLDPGASSGGGTAFLDVSGGKGGSGSGVDGTRVEVRFGPLPGNAVPEPSTVMLLVAGAGALAVAGWRRKRTGNGNSRFGVQCPHGR
jgi:hypothetical protein